MQQQHFNPATLRAGASRRHYFFSGHHSGSEGIFLFSLGVVFAGDCLLCYKQLGLCFVPLIVGWLWNVTVVGCCWCQSIRIGVDEADSIHKLVRFGAFVVSQLLFSFFNSIAQSHFFFGSAKSEINSSGGLRHRTLLPTFDTDTISQDQEVLLLSSTFHSKIIHNL